MYIYIYIHIYIYINIFNLFMYCQATCMLAQATSKSRSMSCFCAHSGARIGIVDTFSSMQCMNLRTRVWFMSHPGCDHLVNLCDQSIGCAGPLWDESTAGLMSTAGHEVDDMIEIVDTFPSMQCMNLQYCDYNISQPLWSVYNGTYEDPWLPYRKAWEYGPRGVLFLVSESPL